MAYILGFITADGNVSKKRDYIRIQLNPKDKYLLEYIASKIQPSQKIYDYSAYSKKRNKTYYSCLLCLSSKIIKEDLSKFGVIPNKTGNHRIDFDIPKEYICDYIRGFFDGDGSVYREKRGNCIRSKISCQSIEFLEDTIKILGLKHKCVYLNTSPPELRLNHNDSLIFRDIIYKNYPCICLERKRIRFYD